jgi:Ankyrin repeats (3 copies)
VLLPWIAIAQAAATLNEQLREAAKRGDSALVRTGGVTAVHNALPVLGINSDEKGTHRIANERGHTVPSRASMDSSITVDKTSILFDEGNIIKGELINVDNESGFECTVGIVLPKEGLLYSFVVRKPDQVKIPRQDWEHIKVAANSGIFIILVPENDPVQIEKLDGKEIVVKAIEANRIRGINRITIKVGSVRQILTETSGGQKRNGWTQLMSAAHMGRTDLVKELLDKGFDVNAKDKIGWTALIYAAQGKPREHADTVKLLLDRGADVNAKDKMGWTALMFAVAEGYSQVVEVILDKGADVNARTEDDETAMEIAWKKGKGRKEIVKLLKAHGAKE